MPTTREKITASIVPGVNPGTLRDRLLDVLAEIEQVAAVMPRVDLVRDVYGQTVETQAELTARVNQETASRVALADRVDILLARPPIPGPPGAPGAPGSVEPTPEFIAAVATAVDVHDPDPGDVRLLFENGLI